MSVLISRYREVFDQGIRFTTNHGIQSRCSFSCDYYYVFAYEISEHVTGGTGEKAQILFFAFYISLLTVILRNRFPISKTPGFYKVVLLSIPFFLLLILIFFSTEYSNFKAVLFSWSTGVVIILSFVYIGWRIIKV